MEAAKAASEASAAADRATTSADAKGHREEAQQQWQNAVAALADARMYAGMVTQAKMDDEAEKAVAEALATQKQMAMDAAGAAKDASDGASQAVMDVDAVKGADLASFARAQDAAADAVEASRAAKEASDAAQQATTVADATALRMEAVRQQGLAEAARNAAATFAGMVMTASNNVNETVALAAAKTAAMAAADAAKTASDAAQAAVDGVMADAGADQASYDEAAAQAGPRWCLHGSEGGERRGAAATSSADAASTARYRHGGAGQGRGGAGGCHEVCRHGG